ncbi:MAG: transporter substrate-binding domain-containing protein [Streptosporangiales bacterium]|nr:transporter substrate-binding domain-containing protein [Streptosporangiales bacterium]
MAALAAAALAVGLAGCAESTEPEGGGSGKKDISLVTEGKLTACTSLPYEPFEFTEGGETVGFEVDLVDLMAKELDVEQEIVDTPWGGIVSGEDFKTSKCDVAYGGATITPEREKVVDFSKPFMDVKQSLLVKKESGIDGLEKLKGKKLGAQQDTTGKIYASKNEKKYGYEIVEFEDYGLLTTAVRTGQVDASIADSGILEYYITQNKDTEIGASYETGEQLGMMVQKKDKVMLKLVNDTLDKAKKDGTYDRLYKKWFGTEPAK